MTSGEGIARNEFHFVFVPDRETVCENLIKGGYLESEKLVNMSKTSGSNRTRVTPDQRFIVFR